MGRFAALQRAAWECFQTTRAAAAAAVAGGGCANRFAPLRSAGPAARLLQADVGLARAGGLSNRRVPARARWCAPRWSLSGQITRFEYTGNDSSALQAQALAGEPAVLWAAGGSRVPLTSDQLKPARIHMSTSRSVHGRRGICRMSDVHRFCLPAALPAPQPAAGGRRPAPRSALVMKAAAALNLLRCSRRHRKASCSMV